MNVGICSMSIPVIFGEFYISYLIMIEKLLLCTGSNFLSYRAVVEMFLLWYSTTPD